MEVNPTNLLEVAIGSSQFSVPFYQRHYEWSEERVRTFWGDLVRLINEPSRTHYLGTIIRHPADASSLGITTDSVRPWVVVDGQQRLTVLMLFLAAMRDAVKHDRKLNGRNAFASLAKARLESEEGTSDTKIHLEKLTTNLYLELSYGERGEKRISKLIPTELNNDREVFENVIIHRSADQRKRHFRHYQILKDECIGPMLDSFKLQDGQPDIASQVNWAHDCLDALKRMQIIFITVDEKVDDVQQIFESINHKGEPLSFTDLIRNHVMSADGMSAADRLKIYKEIWTPIEQALCPLSDRNDGKIVRKSMLEGFFSSYVTMRKGQPVAGKQLFDEFSVQFKRSRAATAAGSPHPLASLKNYAYSYQWINDTAKGEQPEDIKAIVTRFSQLNFITPMPLLLKYVGEVPASYPSAKELDSAFRVLEAFFVRRALLGASVKEMGEYFAYIATLYDSEAPSRTSFAKWLNAKLISIPSTVKRFEDLAFISDEDFRAGIVKERAYARSRNATNFALVAVETKRSRKEIASGIFDYDIEHVLPQEYEDCWLDDLRLWNKGMPDEKIADEVSLLCDTIGNLTLTDYNRELQNFGLKRKQYHKKQNNREVGYRCSNVKICKDDFGTIEQWSFEDIRKRSLAIGNEIIECFPYSVS